MTASLLALFGNGHPSSIVKLACESSQERYSSHIQYTFIGSPVHPLLFSVPFLISVEALVAAGKQIITTAEHAGEGGGGRAAGGAFGLGGASPFGQGGAFSPPLR